MTVEFDPRAAGRSIVNAHNYLKATCGEIAQLLKTVDAQLDARVPSWRSNSGSAVTWERSASMENPDLWIPRYFRRFWPRVDGQPSIWKRAVAVDIWVSVEPRTHGTDEPWIGCYAFQALEAAGISGWRNHWITDIAEQCYDMRWAAGFENRAFDWSMLREPVDGERFQVCGYFLRLTDVQAAEDVRRMIVDPTIDLADGFANEKLPPNLPRWDFR